MLEPSDMRAISAFFGSMITAWGAVGTDISRSGKIVHETLTVAERESARTGERDNTKDRRLRAIPMRIFTVSFMFLTLPFGIGSPTTLSHKT